MRFSIILFAALISLFAVSASAGEPPKAPVSEGSSCVGRGAVAMGHADASPDVDGNGRHAVVGGMGFGMGHADASPDVDGNGRHAVVGGMGFGMGHANTSPEVGSLAEDNGRLSVSMHIGLRVVAPKPTPAGEPLASSIRTSTDSP